MNLNRSLKTLGKVSLGFLLFVAVLLIGTLARVDRSPIEDQVFYKETLTSLDQLAFSSSEGDAWLAGWGKSNMTPDQPVSLVGYAPRGEYEFVQDSSYVKSLLLSNGKTTIAWFSFELLIIHPYLAQTVERQVREAFPAISQVVFTATHTHSGLGGYMPGVLGEFAFGGFEEEIVQEIAFHSVQAMARAAESLDSVSVEYRKSDAGGHLANRFVKDGPIDPYARQLIFKKKSGEKATILTYSAHATCLTSSFMGLSGDYPFYLMDALEATAYDFAMFASGTVGSHRPLRPGNHINDTRDYAKNLAKTIQSQEGLRTEVLAPFVRYGSLQLQLREPHLRISDNWRLRPWLFDQLIGETNPHLDIIQLGDVLLLTSSGEISGVFYEKWERLAEEKGLHLLITTFNGGYMGYITPDELYDEDFHEVREMNWYGPGNGFFFDELIVRIIKKSTPK